jgi:hypothetical protein
MTEDDIEQIVSRISAKLQKQYEDTTKRFVEGMKEMQKRVNKQEENDSKNDSEIDKLKTELVDLKQENKERNTEIENLQLDVDGLVQEKKDKNLIVTGLTEQQLDRDSAIQLLNDKLHKNIRKEEIEYVVKLKNARSNQPNRLRMVFRDKDRKMEIFKQRTKLKDSDQEIWLSDELTKQKNELAFAARQSMRDRRINTTWVYDSKVFVKIKATDKPRIIKSKNDLPK